MKTTRYHDLAFLETARDKVKSDKLKKRLNALLSDVYEQSKDAVLERARVQLVDLIKQKLLTDDEFKLAKIDQKIRKLRDKVQNYVRSPGFISKQLKTINKVSPKEAQIKHKKLQRK